MSPNTTLLLTGTLDHDCVLWPATVKAFSPCVGHETGSQRCFVSTTPDVTQPALVAGEFICQWRRPCVNIDVPEQAETIGICRGSASQLSADNFGVFVCPRIGVGSCTDGAPYSEVFNLENGARVEVAIGDHAQRERKTW